MTKDLEETAKRLLAKGALSSDEINEIAGGCRIDSPRRRAGV